MQPFVFLSYAFLSLALLSSAYGQASRTSGAERRIETMNRQTKQFEQENMGRETKPVVDAKRARQIRSEIEEDLNALQKIYNNILINVQLPADIPTLFIERSASTSRQHAERLKKNLILPSPEVDKETATSIDLPDDGKKSLKLFCLSIYEFITNPIFEPAAPLDAKLALKAKNDLDHVIEVAAKIEAKFKKA